MTRRRLLESAAALLGLSAVPALLPATSDTFTLHEVDTRQYGTPISYAIDYVCQCEGPGSEPHFHIVESVRWMETNHP